MNHVEVFTVEGRDQLAAAVLAAACSTFEEAAKNPFEIRLIGTRTVYSFKNGLHQLRAERLSKAVKRAPKKVFSS